MLKVDHSHAKRLFILLGIVFYLYYGIYKMFFVHFDALGTDFLHGYNAARNFIQFHDMYRMDFYYPPFSVFILLPFSIFPFQASFLVFWIFEHIIVICSFLLIFRIGATINPKNSFTAAIVSICFSMPLYQNLAYGNLNIIIFLGLNVIFYLLSNQKYRLIPLILTFLSFIKVYPAIYLLPFFRSTNLKTIYQFILLSVVILAMSIMVIGIEPHIYFMNHFFKLSKYIGAFSSTSLSFVLKNLLHLNKFFVLLLNALVFSALIVIYWKTCHVKFLSYSDAASVIVGFFYTTFLVLFTLPTSWVFFNSLLIPLFYSVFFLYFENISEFKFVKLFFLLFILINLWEIIVYQLPVTLNGHTMIFIAKHRNAFPILYPAFFSIPFLLNAFMFLWFLRNMEAIHSGLSRSILNKKDA